MIINKATNFAAHCQCFIQLPVALSQIRNPLFPQRAFPSLPSCSDFYFLFFFGFEIQVSSYENKFWITSSEKEQKQAMRDGL